MNPLPDGVPARDYVSELYQLAKDIVDQTPDFHETKGPGRGDRATHQFMSALRQSASSQFGRDFSEAMICGANRLAVDFYFPENQAVVEVALTLRNASNEYEKDILKVLLALEQGNLVGRLVFISKRGAIKRRAEPAPRAFSDWLKKTHGVAIEILEL